MAAHQERALRGLRQYAFTPSPFYRTLHRGLAAAPLAELPVMTKSLLMENYDEVVTDDDVRLTDVQSFLARMEGARAFSWSVLRGGDGRYTGQPGVFVWDAQEWADIFASCSRPFAWGGADLSLTRRTRTAVVSSTTRWYQSALVGATVDSGFIPALWLDSGTPWAGLAITLHAFEPDVLVGYASILRLLAADAAQQRVDLSPTSSAPRRC